MSIAGEDELATLQGFLRGLAVFFDGGTFIAAVRGVGVADTTEAEAEAGAEAE